MAPDTPTWIDTCYAQNILQQAENDKTIKISNMTVKPATAKGDNYLSDMYWVGVDFSLMREGCEIQGKRSFIVKVSPMGGVREELVKSVGVFDIEMSVMSETLPRMSQLLTDCKIGTESLGAPCLFVQRENPIHLTFEDLANRGFQMANRQVGLDLDHCLLALRNLGRFHASSIALKERDPKALEKYSKGFFNDDAPSSMREFYGKATKKLADETRDWEDLNPKIPEKLLKLSNDTWQKLCELTRFREDEFNVLLHGDFWVNNMMFSYDEQRKPIDHIFVDFQLCNYGSLALDLLYFFATSPIDVVRINNRGLLLREYHNSLVSTMAKLKCNTKALSFDDLQEILKDRALFEGIISFVALPLMLVDKSKVKDLNELMESSAEDDVPGYCTSEFKKIMSRLLPFYDSLGMLGD